MRPRFSSLKGCFLILSLVPVSVVVAHHSTAEYDSDPTQVTIEGVITSIRWANPHIEFVITETKDAGETQEWVLGEPSAIAMKNHNISPSLFTVGSKVRVYGAISRRREGRMVGYNFLLLGSSLEVIMVPDRSPGPLWSNNVVGLSASDIYSATGPLPNDRSALFRVWSWEPVPEFWMFRDPDYYPMTKQARAAFDAWNIDDLSDNTVLRCEPPGMPAAMGNPHPMEFVDLGDVIEIRMEEFDQVRRIHMTDAQAPSEIPASLLGYSVGRWEGKALIVETSRVSARYLTRNGVPLSRDARIEERFALNAQNGRLNYRLIVTDPENLTSPFVQDLVWNWHEGAYRQRYDCQVVD